MPVRNEQVQPTPFEAASPPPIQSGGKQVSRRWVAPALLALILLAAAVIFWLPTQVGETPPAIPPTTAAPPTAGVAATTPTTVPAPSPAPATADEASPWSEAQLAKLRKEAQDVLAELLEVQFELQERGVQQWAPAEFAGAASAAQAGDELYRQREFSAATESYRGALQKLQALQDRLPEEMDRLLERTRLAIEAGDEPEARTALELAAVVEPENAALPGLQERLDTLPGLLILRHQASAAEEEGDLARAEQRLTEASALDPQHQAIAAELERVAALHTRQRFNSAMSEGYQALDEGRFDAARRSFREAAELNPGSGEAATALEDVAAAQSARRLAGLRDRGRDHEADERWSDAVAVYEEALNLDGSVVFASEGLARSRPRARLDEQIRGVLAEPGRLADVRVAGATEELLREARAISPAGPVLSAQVTQLELLLEKANTPVTVTLYSDRETEVVVQKIARLGRFDQRQLELRPGTYVAVGSRAGYRDVRHTFTVSHEADMAPVTVICQEAI